MSSSSNVPDFQTLDELDLRPGDLVLVSYTRDQVNEKRYKHGIFIGISDPWRMAYTFLVDGEIQGYWSFELGSIIQRVV